MLRRLASGVIGAFLLLALVSEGAPPAHAQDIVLWPFNVPNSTAGFTGQPSNGATNALSWVGDNGGALRIDYTGSVGFNTAVANSLPPLPWDVVTLSADVFVPKQVTISRLGLGVTIDGQPTSQANASVHLIGQAGRGTWNQLSWPVHPGQLNGAGHRLGFALDTNQPMPGPLMIQNVRAIPPVINVDAGHVISTFDPATLWGNNIAYYYPPNFYTDPQPRQLARDAGFSFFRIPGGLNTDVYHWNGNGVRLPNGSINPAARRPDGSWAINYSGWAPGFEVQGETPTGDPLNTLAPNFANVGAYDHTPAVDVQQMVHWVTGLGAGAQLMVDVNVGTGSHLVATGPNNTLQASDVAAGAQEAAQWVRYFNQVQGLHVKYWEIGNELEPYGAEIGSHVQDTSAQGWHWMTANDYAVIFRAYGQAMKAVDPAIELAGPVGYVGASADVSGTGSWIATFLQRDADIVDVVDIHFYDWGHSESEYLAAPSNLETQETQVRDWIKQYAPNRAGQIGVGVSEWGDYSNKYPIGDGLFSADLMGRAAVDQLTFANAWDLGGMIPNNGQLKSLLGFNPGAQSAGRWQGQPANGATNALSWTANPAYTRPDTTSLQVDYRGSSGANAGLSAKASGVNWNLVNGIQVDVYIPEVPGNDAITFWLRLEHADGSVDDSYRGQVQQPIWGQWNRLVFPVDAAKLAAASRVDLVVNSPKPIATPLYFASLDTQLTDYQPNGRYWAAYMYHHYFSNALVVTDMGRVSRDRLVAYASRSADGSLYLMVVNKDSSSDIGVPININNYGAAATAEVHTWSAANYVWDPSHGVAVKDTPPSEGWIPAGNHFSYVFPRSSITAIRLTPG
ncbi:MAG TPA: hypothetical protein VMV93_12570 [Chloroflexota bacterium]|nr:hypothetical protein [Chloroflexota bacterium]